MFATSLKTYRYPIVASGLLLLGASAVVSAPVGARARRQAQPAQAEKPQNLPFTFGDVTLSGYDKMDLSLGKSAEALGPNTTVESNDPNTKAVSTLRANRIIAYMAAKTNNQVDHVDVIGKVRFTQTVPFGEGKQLVRGSGTKGTYYKKQDKTVLQGPVQYFAERPTGDGKAKQTIEGTADSASYDGAKQVLTLNGHVKASVNAPGDLPEHMVGDVAADQVVIELGEQPYKIHLDGGSMNLRPVK